MRWPPPPAAVALCALQYPIAEAMETTADGGLQKDSLIKRFLNYNKVAILNPAGILRAVSRSTIALQNRNAAGDEVPLCTQLSFPVISLMMVC